VVSAQADVAWAPVQHVEAEPLWRAAVRRGSWPERTIATAAYKRTVRPDQVDGRRWAGRREMTAVGGGTP